MKARTGHIMATIDMPYPPRDLISNFRGYTISEWRWFLEYSPLVLAPYEEGRLKVSCTASAGAFCLLSAMKPGSASACSGHLLLPGVTPVALLSVLGCASWALEPALSAQTRWTLVSCTAVASPAHRGAPYPLVPLAVSLLALHNRHGQRQLRLPAAGGCSSAHACVLQTGAIIHWQHPDDLEVALHSLLVSL